MGTNKNGNKKYYDSLFQKQSFDFCRRESDLQRRVEELDKQICNSSDLLNLDSELKEYERLKRELDNLYET